MDREDLIKIRNEYTNEFNKVGMKSWKKKKTYAYSVIISSLDLLIKYINEFNEL